MLLEREREKEREDTDLNKTMSVVMVIDEHNTANVLW